MIPWILILLVSSLCGKSLTDCQFDMYKQCNHAAGQSFRNSRVLGRPSGINDEYCSGIQAIIDCLHEHKHCTGVFIDEFRIVLLQIGIMSKKMVCAEMNYVGLKQMTEGVKYSIEVSDIELLAVNGCEKHPFRECMVKRFRQDMENNLNVCKNVETLVSCLKEKRSNCRSELLNAFVIVLDEHAKHILGVVEEAATQDFTMCLS